MLARGGFARFIDLVCICVCARCVCARCVHVVCVRARMRGWVFIRACVNCRPRPSGHEGERTPTSSWRVFGECLLCVVSHENECACGVYGAPSDLLGAPPAACLHACLLVCMLACLLACLHACLAQARRDTDSGVNNTYILTRYVQSVRSTNEPTTNLGTVALLLLSFPSINRWCAGKAWLSRTVDSMGCGKTTSSLRSTACPCLVKTFRTLFRCVHSVLAFCCCQFDRAVFVGTGWLAGWHRQAC